MGRHSEDSGYYGGERDDVHSPPRKYVDRRLPAIGCDEASSSAEVDMAIALNNTAIKSYRGESKPVNRIRKCVSGDEFRERILAALIEIAETTPRTSETQDFNVDSSQGLAPASVAFRAAAHELFMYLTRDPEGIAYHKAVNEARSGVIHDGTDRIESHLKDVYVPSPPFVAQFFRKEEVRDELVRINQGRVARNTLYWTLEDSFFGVLQTVLVVHFDTTTSLPTKLI